MNRYYDYEPIPSCGIGKHPGTNPNGSCTRCDTYPAREAESARKVLVDSIPKTNGKHRAEEKK